MGDKVIYVRPADEQLWQWAVDYARARRMPVSGLVLAALELYRDLAERGELPDPGKRP